MEVGGVRTGEKNCHVTLSTQLLLETRNEAWQGKDPHTRGAFAPADPRISEADMSGSIQGSRLTRRKQDRKLRLL